MKRHGVDVKVLEPWNLRTADGTVYDLEETVFLHPTVWINRTQQRDKIFEWAYSAGINVDLLYATLQDQEFTEVWGIKDSSHRAMFVLRWS